MAEPSERDYQAARDAGVRCRSCGLGLDACPDTADGCCVTCLHEQVPDEIIGMLARAIAAAREEADAAGFERGRREGLEEAARAFDAVAEWQRACAKNARECSGDRSGAWFNDQQAENAEEAAGRIRALIGGGK